MKQLKSLFVIFLFAASTIFSQTEWTLDAAHSSVGFSVSHLVISETEGKFKSFDGSITSSSDDFEDAKITFTIDVNSINTDNEKRDAHLKSEEFFDAEKYPEMKFVSKSFKKKSGKKYVLVGDFTMKGVTKEVELDVKFNGVVKDPWGNTKAGFKVSGELNRFDYGLKWSATTEAGGLVVGKEVELEINIELTKKS